MGIAPIALVLFGPPALPSDGDAVAPQDPPPAVEVEEELENDPGWDTPDQSEGEQLPAVEADEPATSEPAVEGAAPAVTPGTTATPAPAAAPTPSAAPAAAQAAVTPSPAATGSTGESPEESGGPEGPKVSSAETATKPEEPEKKKKFPFKFFRFGVQGKLMYTHGTSDKNGLFDRDKSIQDSIDNGMVTMSGAGDLGETQFGGFAGGFLVDVELFGINAWFDFHKFFTPGGMWSLLAGYDHDLSFAKDRLNLNLGLGFGLQKVFLGEALSELYYDEDNPESVNIGTTGMEMRAMVGLDIKIVGPLYTGPALMGGYHYLWTANSSEVTVEKGLHYSAGWNVSLRFALPPG